MRRRRGLQGFLDDHTVGLALVGLSILVGIFEWIGSAS